MKTIGNIDPDLSMLDIADAFSLPALYMAAAVASMERIVARAKDINREERERAILDFVGAFLFASPSSARSCLRAWAPSVPPLRLPRGWEVRPWASTMLCRTLEVASWAS